LNGPAILRTDSRTDPSKMFYNNQQLISFSTDPVISNFNCHAEGKSEQFGKPTVNTIPSIIRGFKSTVTKQINDNNANPGKKVWERSSYLRIIGTHYEFSRTSVYIKENPHSSDAGH
jgi:hypothetical protein